MWAPTTGNCRSSGVAEAFASGKESSYFCCLPDFFAVQCPSSYLSTRGFPGLSPCVGPQTQVFAFSASCKALAPTKMCFVTIRATALPGLSLGCPLTAKTLEVLLQLDSTVPCWALPVGSNHTLPSLGYPNLGFGILNHEDRNLERVWNLNKGVSWYMSLQVTTGTAEEPTNSPPPPLPAKKPKESQLKRGATLEGLG